MSEFTGLDTDAEDIDKEVEEDAKQAKVTILSLTHVRKMTIW